MQDYKSFIVAKSACILWNSTALLKLKLNCTFFTYLALDELFSDNPPHL